MHHLEDALALVRLNDDDVLESCLLHQTCTFGKLDYMHNLCTTETCDHIGSYSHTECSGYISMSANQFPQEDPIEHNFLYQSYKPANLFLRWFFNFERVGNYVYVI